MADFDHDYQRREAMAVEAIKDAIPPELKSDMLPESKGWGSKGI